jgi:hypothetical protein
MMKFTTSLAVMALLDSAEAINVMNANRVANMHEPAVESAVEPAVEPADEPVAVETALEVLGDEAGSLARRKSKGLGPP